MEFGGEEPFSHAGFPLRVPIPRSPDPAGHFLPLLRGLHLPGGDPAPGRHQLPALWDHPEHVVSPREGLGTQGMVLDAFGMLHWGFSNMAGSSCLGQYLGTFLIFLDIPSILGCFSYFGTLPLFGIHPALWHNLEHVMSWKGLKWPGIGLGCSIWDFSNTAGISCLGQCFGTFLFFWDFPGVHPTLWDHLEQDPLRKGWKPQGMVLDGSGMLHLGFFQHGWKSLPGALPWDIPDILGHSQYFGTFLVSIPLFQGLLADPGGGRARAASPGSVPVPGAAFPAEGALQQVQDTAIVPDCPQLSPGWVWQESQAPMEVPPDVQVWILVG